MRSTIFLYLLFFQFSFLFSQHNMTADSFDFWLGTWDAYWGDSLRGTNMVKRDLDDKVIEENFQFNDLTFIGKSWSVFNPGTGSWKQTWVDNNGAYMTFEGELTDSTVIFNMTNPVVKNGQTCFMRMVFKNITADSFDWDWEQSSDKISWMPQWQIHYVRQKN